MIRITWFLLLSVFLFFPACGSSPSLDDALDGLVPDPAQEALAFEQASLNEMEAGLKARLERGADWYGQATNTARLKTLVREMAGREEGCVSLVKVFGDWTGQEAFDPLIRSVFFPISEAGSETILDLVKTMDFQSPKPILAELLAVLANATNQALLAEFSKLIQGYDLVPGIFLPAFETMPLDRFHRFADFTKSDLKLIAQRRLREEWVSSDLCATDCEGIVRSVRDLVDRRTPMAAVLLVDLLTEEVLCQPNLERFTKNRAVNQLYQLIEGLKYAIEDRNEDEKMFFASVMARLYRARE